MRLTVVGNSGSYPGPDSAASCYLVEEVADGRAWRILLDLGNGALGALHRYADPLAIDAVLLSHLHADHCLDLCGYYVMRCYHPDGHQPRIPVWGPDGVAERMAKAYDLDPDPGMGEEFDFRDYGPEPIRLGPFTITVREVYHPVTAYSLRIEAGGRTLTYSGDTAACTGLTENAAGSDLFLCEASFLDSLDNPPGVHLTGSEAGRPPPRPAPRACCSPTSRPGTTGSRCWPRRARRTPATSRSRCRARPTPSEPATPGRWSSSSRPGEVTDGADTAGRACRDPGRRTTLV